MNAMRRSSTVLLVMGVLALLFGIAALVWPISTAIALVVLWGAYALVDGVSAIAMAFRTEGASAKAFLVVVGVIGILAGLIAMFRPISSAVTLAWILGIWLIVRGILELVAAFADIPNRARWLLILGGLLWLVAGILFVANPGAGVLTISTWVGILALIWGGLLVAAGWDRRSVERADTAAA